MNIEFNSGKAALKTFHAQVAEKIETTGVFQRKATEYLALFIALLIIYSCYLKSALAGGGCTTVNIDLALVPAMLKFLCFTGWPFALMAYLDSTWRSKDAGHVFLAAYIATNVFWIHKYGGGFCPYSLPIRLFPYVLSAVVFHGIGSWCHTSSAEE